MKRRLFLKFVVAGFVFAATAFAILSQLFAGEPTLAQQAPPNLAPDGGGEYALLPHDEISLAERRAIQQKIQQNIEKLQREGRLAPASAQTIALAYPIRNAPGNNDFGVDGISNFVDQNLAFPNQLRDYNCGARTYDQSSGYNHAGVDIFTFPFGWRKMDEGAVEIVAAAPGTIVYKSEGNFDRNCGFGNGNWNAVYVRHADGSIAWYGHMKRGSVTAKSVGDTVTTNERLGVVGSSGNSTGPHLHLELYNAANQLQDPFQGTCNTLNNFSWWEQQPAYRVTRINKLMTHHAPPDFATCPNPEMPNQRIVFRPGENIIVAGYYRDQLQNQQSQFSLVRPDGTVYQTWTHTSPNTYSASYWFYTRTLPVDAPAGAWKFRVAFNSQTYEQTFRVARNTRFDFDGDGKSDPSVFRPADSVWYLLNSNSGFNAAQWGVSEDRLAPADYDGDGRTDIAVYRNGVWYVQRSQANLLVSNFGLSGDIPVPADYNGDGLAELAVYRAGVWHLFDLATNQYRTAEFGLAGDKPVPADYDGDLKTDFAVYRNGTWFLLRSTEGFAAAQFGLPSDKPTPADFDGDSKTDLAVYRDGTWYVQRSERGFTAFQWGLGGDVPAPADYDGDGKTDAAVYRSGDWYILRSQQSGFAAFPFGLAGDKPVAASFIE